ncbi:MAG TPA: DUF1501 domain-containing protein, partial [Gemmataceae bacterium]|nr:DUF1501 domain-containing protein [Gemmataceae bacterium]
MTTAFRTDCERFHRRDFLRLGSAGLLGLGLADLLRLEASAASGRKKATSVLMVWLAGGPSTIDVWDLKPAAPDHIRGEFKPVATSARGVQICELLPKTAKVMHHCSLVRSLHHNIPEHGVGTQYMTTGNRPSAALEYPGLGSLASRLLPAPAGVPSYVAFQRTAGPGHLGTAYAAFEVEGGAGRGRLRVPGVSLPADFSLDELADRDRLRNTFDTAFRALDRTEVPASLDKFHQQALDILRSNKTRQAFDLGKEPKALRDAYGRRPFGESALTARRLIEAGVRFVTVGLGGWDTHANNFQALRGNLLPQLDGVLGALIGDLAERGLLESTLVYCAGEFNRTPRINGSAGRDHWAQSMAVLLAGGAVRKGHVHGS